MILHKRDTSRKHLRLRGGCIRDDAIWVSVGSIPALCLIPLVSLDNVNGETEQYQILIAFIFISLSRCLVE